MGLIPRPFLDELLSQTDIVAFIDSYVPLKKQGTSYVACCPFHQEKTPSFNVITKKQFFHCFGCGVSGNAISFAMSYLNQGFSEAVETLATRMGMQVPREGGSPQKNASFSLYQLLARVAQFYQRALHVSGQSATRYLEKRGVQGDVLQRYHVGYAPDGWHALESTQLKPNQAELITTGMLIQKDGGGTYDRYRHRLMFPIHDRSGRIIGFGGRALDDNQKPKYLNSPETVIFQKNRELYGLYQVLQHDATPPQILVVEGYMDVIALAQMGINHAVAALGTATSIYHMQLLAKHTQRVIFCFDGDSAGRQAAWRALESTLPSLSAGLDAAFIFLPEGHDPDSYIRSEGVEAFRQRAEEGMPLNQFFFETLMKPLDINSLAGKSQLIHATKPYLFKIPDGPYKHLLLDELSRLTHLELHRISQLIEEAEPSSQEHSPYVIKRTPARIATALILQHPDIYAAVLTEIPPSLLADKKHRVLQQLMQRIAAEPTINTASLVESFRDSPLFDALNKLAAWQHNVPPEALAKEFTDIVLFLAKQNDDRDVQQLIDRARHQGLSLPERLQLQAMLQKRHLPS